MSTLSGNYETHVKKLPHLSHNIYEQKLTDNKIFKISKCKIIIIIILTVTRVLR